MNRSGPPPEPAAADGTGALGLKLLIVSLAVLFASALASFWVVRGNTESWTGAGAGFRVPAGIWAATAVLGLLSSAAQRRALRLSFGLAVLFLLVQAWNWRELIAAHLPPGAKSLYAFNFYLLTGLHALHVLGGLIYHLFVLRRPTAAGARNLATYWHFLAVTWLALAATLVVGARPDLTAAGIQRAFTGIAVSALGGFVLCWLRVELALARAEGGVSVLIGLFPPIAFLRGFMKADELRLRGWLFWWAAFFGVALSAGCIAVAVAMTA
ncbi:MAG: hypothetical protein D6702_02345, partial [Planctomycetota bacterium]